MTKKGEVKKRGGEAIQIPHFSPNILEKDDPEERGRY